MYFVVFFWLFLGEIGFYFGSFGSYFFFLLS